jgi:uncharacterized protein YukE
MDAGAPTLGPFVIPGDPGALQAIAVRIRQIAAQVGDIRSRVESNGLGGSWSGRAADAFKSALGELPGELDKLYNSFSTAADAVTAYAGKVADFQSQANWLAAQLRQIEQEVNDAQSRQQSAERDFRSALNTRNSASDPASQARAQSAIDGAARALAKAGADQEASQARGKSLMGTAESNWQDFQVAAQSCASQLQTASQLGIQNSFFKPIGDFFGHVGGAVVGVVTWTAGKIGEGIGAAGHWMDEHWKDIRHVLDALKKPLEIIGAVAIVVAAAATLQPELLVAMPWLVGAVGASDALTTGMLATDSAITGGDAVEAAIGSGRPRAKAEADLETDATSLASDYVTRGAGGETKQALSGMQSAQKYIGAFGPGVRAGSWGGENVLRELEATQSTNAQTLQQSLAKVVGKQGVLAGVGDNTPGSTAAKDGSWGDLRVFNINIPVLSALGG